MTDNASTKPWDSPGLPSRSNDERCRWHDGHCAYRDDDPARCTLCHATLAAGKCTCEHGPLTLDRANEIRNEYQSGELTLRELTDKHDIGATHLIRILKGVYNRVRDKHRKGVAA